MTDPCMPPSIDDNRLERHLIVTWLAAAGVVTILRVLYAGDFGYDLTLQLQAAQNFLAGRGLAIYWPESDNLAAPLALQTLRFWPAGFSLYAASAMALGLSADMAVKLLGAFTTMIGWWGWARLAFAYMNGGMRESRVWRFVAYAIAILCPLFFTIPWGGTDHILWATVPWVLSLLSRGPRARPSVLLRADFTAGILTGLCVFTRYASLLLAAYGGLIIVAQYRGRAVLTALRIAGFSIGVIAVILIQLSIGSPASRVTEARIATGSARAWDNVATMSGVNHALFFWAPRRLQLMWERHETLAFAAALPVVLLPALVLIARRTAPPSEWLHDLRIVAAGLLVIVPLFLWLCSVLDDYPIARIARYYFPVRPLALFIAYYLATTDPSLRRSPVASAVRLGGRAYVIVFVLVISARLALAAVPGALGDRQRSLLLSNQLLLPMPSFQPNYELSPARNFVLRVLEAEPETILVTNLEHWFFAEPSADPSRIQRWQACGERGQLRAKYVSGPTRLLFFARDRGGSPDTLQWRDADDVRLQDCLTRFPGLRLIRRFPDEQLKVLRAEIPAGTQLPLTPASEGTEPDSLDGQP